ncbi:tRNA (adenosine(37)-N6)-threonylcarbamoyltransferase complex dimerization subunit type 1 TsaB [Tropicimonas isoalkanivorans]|uniref:tRNA threonylcarbamoyl adenosine modification protein YeaZ n=1 Tax=Tropicimonas isoalkanivorans TaxID=441112 RepID=A0A1I1LIZ4_9RHOB|nr:tRNA (adenosine(37)-N6)-threonylcarbamoyltransferase complex dimerization subunit type 1 TsaB [Tropicimonas isoalkanivorans]SFC72532.1 tRNA threonylcarbamoyl adenosine modification protein YeaZ [Tropicimonas isoalkanivorans]
MRSDPTILAFDTSAAHCAAALLSAGEIRAEKTLEMGRGQAEALMPLLEEVLAQSGLAMSHLDAIGVGIGPGNFTGIRISVAAARGLSLALGVPAVGVSMFEVMASETPEGGALVSLPAPRGMTYVQPFHDGRPNGPAQLFNPGGPPEPGFAGLTVIGAASEEIARLHHGVTAPADAPPIAPQIARIAASRLAEGHARGERPCPLYVRPADAAPPADPPPAILQ